MWIDDNVDLEQIVNELKISIKKYTFTFFDNYLNKNIKDVIEEYEKNNNDRYHGSYRLYYLYKYLKMEDKAEKRKEIFIEEGKKSGLKEKELSKIFEWKYYGIELFDNFNYWTTST